MEYKCCINPESAGKMVAPISLGIRTCAKQVLFTSGIVAIDGDGELVGVSDIRGQTKQIMENIGAILLKGGMTFDDVVKVTMYLRDIRQLKDVIEIRSEYLKENRPVATAVEVSALADSRFLIEMEVIAVSGQVC